MARDLRSFVGMQPQTIVPIAYLVAIDDSPMAAHTLDVACALGSSLGGLMELHIVHVVPILKTMPTQELPMSGSPRSDAESGRPILEQACESARARFGGTIIGHLALGDPWREIVQLASHLAADLVVVGTAGRTGLARAMLGSVAEQVVRHAGCPVLVARPKSYELATEISIDPPCRDCLAVQSQTARARLWCTRHQPHHPHAHLHYETPPTFALGSMNFRP